MSKIDEKELTFFLKAIAPKNRIKILNIVYKGGIKCGVAEKQCCAGSTCIKDVAKDLGLANSTISHHVKELVVSGALSVSICGKYRYLRVNKEKFETIKKICERFSK